MSHLGSSQITAIIVAPPEHADEGDRLFASRAAWMEATHHRDGKKALLSYSMCKGPELTDPMDPGSDPTGSTCFVLSEVYETDAGVLDHFQQAAESWGDFAAMGEWMEKCKVTRVTRAEIVQSLW